MPQLIVVHISLVTFAVTGNLHREKCTFYYTILSAINTGIGLGQRHRIIPHAALNAVNSYFVQMSSAKGEHMTQNSYKICKGWTFQV